jgi:hypothetical protein
MDCKTHEPNVTVLPLPWAVVKGPTTATRSGRGDWGTEQGDLVYIDGSDIVGVLNNNKTHTAYGDTYTDALAYVDIDKAKIRTTENYDGSTFTAGVKVYFKTADGDLTTTSTSNKYAGISLGVSGSVLLFMLQ